MKEEIKFHNGFAVILNPKTADKKLLAKFKDIGEVYMSYMTTKNKRCYLVHFEHVIGVQDNFAPCYEKDLLHAPGPRDEIDTTLDEYVIEDLKKLKERYGI